LLDLFLIVVRSKPMSVKALEILCAATIAVAVAVACDIGPQSGRGLHLPDGDTEKGRRAFVELGCPGCHEVAGVVAAAPEGELPVIVRLGGPVRKVETYGELVTSIVNPSHGLTRLYPAEKVSIAGKSRMKDFNDTMTVAQLIDLVAFLQSQYELIPPRVRGR
jgi:hypothetical protein